MIFMARARGGRSRAAHLLGVTEHPGNGFVTQVARDLVGDLAETAHQVKFLTRDRGTKFTASSDEVFRSEGAEVIKALVRAPRANALAERSVRTARVECLDRALVLGATSKRCSGSTSATTTSSGLIAAFTSAYRWAGLRLRDRQASR